eukprot:TRINITY_DN9752_c0_g1_i1.p1 TRINITY_DN9752_c0_g1~~TRINITY_DN9752_c0_g1_i1.p1  ORF type:complete len:151 (+),score=7.72 TRINITY_DN9752_c0_g1_i1:939-1391(+)
MKTAFELTSMIAEIVGDSHKKQKPWALAPQQLWFANHILLKPYLWTISTWSAATVKRRMRMSKGAFQFLLPYFQRSASLEAAGCNKCRRVTPEVWLGIAIRDLASGYALDVVCDSFGVAESNYSSKLEQLMQAIVEACLLSKQRPMTFMI